jgi:hypothetical protein
VSGLVIFPGGWPSWAGAPTTDDLYEEKLKECRLNGHDLSEGWADGLSTFYCQRCGTRWTEDE